MFLEALVVTVCLQGAGGCSETTSAYYKQSVVLQDINRNIEDYGKRITRNNEWLVYAATPLYAIASQKPATIKVYKGTTISVDPWKQAVALQWNY